MPKAIIHLEECEPEDHPEWREVTAFVAWNEYEAAHCPQTEYMAQELFPSERVWLEVQQ